MGKAAAQGLGLEKHFVFHEHQPERPAGDGNGLHEDAYLLAGDPAYAFVFTSLAAHCQLALALTALIIVLAGHVEYVALLAHIVFDRVREKDASIRKQKCMAGFSHSNTGDNGMDLVQRQVDPYQSHGLSARVALAEERHGITHDQRLRS